MFAMLMAAFSAIFSGLTARGQSVEANITPIFVGGGQYVEGWRSTFWYDQWITGEVGLRIVTETQSSVHSGDIYSVPTGVQWRLEYSVDSSWLAVANYQVKLLIDQDPSQGERFQVVAPFTSWANFYGNFDTSMGGGELGTFYPLAYNHTIVQQSLDMGVNVTLNATYTYRVLVYDQEGVNLLASPAIQVVVGLGGLPPDVVLYPLVDVNGAKAGTTSITNYVIPGGTLTLQDKVNALRVRYANDNKKCRATIAALADAEYKAVPKRITWDQRDQMKQQASVLP